MRNTRLRSRESDVKAQSGTVQSATKAERAETTDLFERHATAIYRYCLRRLGSPEEAEDALQVTYLNAWRSLKDGCRPAARKAWLFQIAANVCASTLRTKLGPARVELRNPQALDELPARDGAESEELLGLTGALRELPTRQRRALLLRDWRGLSYEEIAADLGVSDAAVETLLFRARNRVAATLAGAEWRAKLATSTRAIFVAPFAFLRMKSATMTGAGHLKVALGIAGGTVAPLVAFGLVQILLSQPHEATRAHDRAGAVSRAAVTEFMPGLDDGHPIRRVTSAASRPDKAVHAKAPHEKHGKPRAHAGAGGAPGNGHPQPSSPVAPASHPEKVVLCHGTHSSVQPHVTIDVSEHALRGHREDALGACG